MNKIVSLCKRRGFIFPSSEIYGGIGATYDYGHVGVLLKNNVKAAWWKANVMEKDFIVGQDAAIIMHPTTWVASGHVASFTDPLVDCKSCKERFREDHLREGKYGEVKSIDGIARCPLCGGELTRARKFNLMFKTHMGPVEEEAAIVYLRPETAQGIFVDFKTIQSTTRKKIPFGIAQIGKAFRNEITPGNFIYRTREFEQMEIEFFCEPGTDEEWHKFWLEERLNWYVKYGIQKDHLRLRQHTKEELSHYSKATSDVEYLYPFGWGELEGIANRTDFDLTQHQKYSGKEMTYFDEEKKKSYIPYVIEPSAGADRSTLAFLLDAYHEEKDQSGEIRIVLKLHPFLAPFKAAVFPLVANKPDLVKKAKQVYNLLRTNFWTDFDDIGNIGKRYRKQDEIGTPWCVTVDYQTLKDETATVRDRDTMEQIRVKIKGLADFFRKKLEP